MRLPQTRRRHFQWLDEALVETGLYREHEVWQRTTSVRMQSLSRLPDTRNQISDRECGQLPAGMNAPRLKCLLLLRREVQHIQRKIPHRVRLIAGWHHRDSGSTQRETNGSIKVLCY